MSMKFVPSADGKSEFVTGAATVTMLEEGKVRICYLDRFDRDGKITKEINFADGKKCHIYEMSELPVVFDSEVGAEIVLRVKSEGSKIVEFLPETATGVEARFVEFFRTNGKDTPPIPTEKKKFKDTDADVLQFCAIFKIESGEFEGKTVAQYLQFSQSGKAKKSGNPYSFATFTKDEDGNVALGFQPRPDGSTGYKWSDQIYDLRHCGLLDGDAMAMPEDGNPLSLIEAKLQRANKLVKLDIEKGYVVSIASAKKATFQVAKKTEAELKTELGFNPAEEM